MEMAKLSKKIKKFPENFINKLQETKAKYQKQSRKYRSAGFN